MQGREVSDSAADSASSGASWRDRLAQRVSRAFLVVYMAAIVLIAATMRGRVAQPLMVGFAVLGALTIAPSALFNRPQGALRAWLLIAPALFISLVGFALVGFLSGPAVVLTMTLMLSGLLLGRRVMLVLSVATASALVFIAWGMVNGVIPAPNPENVIMTRAAPWVRTIGVTYFAISLFGTLLIEVVSRLTETLDRVQSETALRQQAERARAEAEIAALEANQLETIGRLAAGVAHDFNNNLTAIMGCAELLKVELATNSEQHVLADEILSASQRAAELTRQLLAYSRKTQVARRPVDVQDLVRDTITLVRRSTDPRIVIEMDFKADGATVIADPTLLHSAVLNLLLNARDAMPEGGRIFVSTLPYELREPSLRFGRDLKLGSYVLVEIEDTGTGIPKDVLPRIFDPFFTTKPVGKGTGLGLAAVVGTVKSLSGGVEVQTELGQGSSFRLLLPRSNARPQRESQPAARVVRGEGRILVVDDEASVRNTAVAALSSLGYTVSEAPDGEHAIALVRTSSAFDLVLLDLKMPQLSGEATFQQLRALAPKLRVLLWSGYGEEHDVGLMLQQGAMGFVQKPFSIGDLSRAVEGALNGDAHSARQAAK